MGRLILSANIFIGKVKLVFFTIIEAGGWMHEVLLY
jgi:hypothetical protein